MDDGGERKMTRYMNRQPSRKIAVLDEEYNFVGRAKCEKGLEDCSHVHVHGKAKICHV